MTGLPHPTTNGEPGFERTTRGARPSSRWGNCSSTFVHGPCVAAEDGGGVTVTAGSTAGEVAAELGPPDPLPASPRRSPMITTSGTVTAVAMRAARRRTGSIGGLLG